MGEYLLMFVYLSVVKSVSHGQVFLIVGLC